MYVVIYVMCSTCKQILHREVQLASCIILLLALFLLRRLFLFFYKLFDVSLLSNVSLGNHDRNIGPCGTICRVSMDVWVFWVYRMWNNREWWGWFVLLFYLIVEDIEELSHYLELLL